MYLFKFTLLLIDATFLASRIRQYLYQSVGGEKNGFEDLLQQQVTKLAHDEFGVELDGAHVVVS